MSKIRSGGSILSSAIEALTTRITATGAMPSLAEVANEIRVQVRDLQQIVPSIERLQVIMAENAMYLLYDTIARHAARMSPDDPVAQFKAIGHAYLEWGEEHPREFRIIGSMPSTAFQQNSSLMRYENAIDVVMLKILQRAQQDGTVPPEQDLRSLIAIARTYAYGVVSKMLLGDLARWNPGLTDAEAAKQNLDTLINQFLKP